jgi:hypothetical protein
MRRRGWKNWVAAGALVGAGALAGSAAVRLPDGRTGDPDPEAGALPPVASVGQIPEAVPPLTGVLPAPATDRAAAVHDAVRSAVSLISLPAAPAPPAPLAAGARPSAVPSPAPAPSRPAPVRAQSAPCTDIGLGIVSQPAAVRPGETFTWTVSVRNPNSRALQRVSLDLRLSASPGTRFEVTGTVPPADSVTPTRVAYDDIGPLRPGAQKDIRLSGRVDPRSAGGQLVNEASASGECQPGATAAEAVEAQTAEAALRHEGPAVSGGVMGSAGSRSAAAPGGPQPLTAVGDRKVAAGAGAFARTGGVVLGPAVGLILAGVVLRRSGRRNPSA